MRISEVASATGLSVSNIRFYEKKGLLTPTREEESKYRDYTLEDVARLKQIILYRKMDVPVETIYLILKGEVSLEVVLRRQEEELLEKKEMIQGSIDLCQKLMSEENPEHIDVDFYLNYVKEEEEQGKRFAEVEELLEDFADFMGISPWSGNPMGAGFGDWRVRRICSLVLLVGCILIAPIMIAENILQAGSVLDMRVIFWILWFLCLAGGFLGYLKSKKRL